MERSARRALGPAVPPRELEVVDLPVHLDEVLIDPGEVRVVAVDALRDEAEHLVELSGSLDLLVLHLLELLCGRVLVRFHVLQSIHEVRVGGLLSLSARFGRRGTCVPFVSRLSLWRPWRRRGHLLVAIRHDLDVRRSVADEMVDAWHSTAKTVPAVAQRRRWRKRGRAVWDQLGGRSGASPFFAIFVPKMNCCK